MSDIKPIRVLHIITRMIVGGAQENTLLSVEGLDKLPEYEVTLASGVDNGPEGELLSRARTTTRLVIIPELGRDISPLADLKAFWKLYRVIKRGRYHIVHTHSSKAGVLGRIAAIGRDKSLSLQLRGCRTAAAVHDYLQELDRR